MEKKILMAVLVLSLVGNMMLGYFLVARSALGYKAKYSDMKSSYISLAGEQKYLLEVMLKSPEDFQSLMPEYKDVSKDEFQEGMRRKIVKLEMETDELKNQ